MQLIEAVEASNSTDSGKLHLFPWKLPLTSMEVNMLPPTYKEIYMEADILPPTSMEVVETFMEVDRTEVCGLLWKSRGGSGKFVVLVEVGVSM